MFPWLKESDIRPQEIPSPKDSAFLANMRSHRKIFDRLAEFGEILREPGADFPEGVENDLGSTENGQNKSHFQTDLVRLNSVKKATFVQERCAF